MNRKKGHRSGVGGVSRSADVARICILLGLYNGATNLAAQLQSFADQTDQDWDLIVSDDGSTDAGPAMVRQFAKEMGPRGHRVELVAGPRAGFVANFLSLIAQAPPDAWIALSDQDDVWLPERLERGRAVLTRQGGDGPTLYCSRTWITTADLTRHRLSVQFLRPAGLRNALVQNIAAGNTILLDAAASDLARAAAPEAASVPGLAAHDWWLYLLITGVGGTVINDPTPTLLYRQHGGNTIGVNDGWRARWYRIKLVLSGRFRAWNTANIAAMRASAPRLTADNRALVEQFAKMRCRALPGRLVGFARMRLYRQSNLAQAAMWLALALRRL